MPNPLKQLVTDYDNTTFDTGRSIGLLVVIAMIIFAGHDVFIVGKPFNAQEFGIGIASVLTGIGAYVWGDNRGRQGYSYSPYPSLYPRAKVTIPIEKMPIEPQG